jgi:hypothetical protein
VLPPELLKLPAGLFPRCQRANRMRSRIRTLKRGFRLGAHQARQPRGSQTWTGQGTFTHNLIKIAP